MTCHSPHADRHAWLRLTLSGPLGISPLRLLTRLGSPRAIFESSYAELTAHCAPGTARMLLSPVCDVVRSRIDRALAWCARPGHTLLAIGDAHYPPPLLNLADPPVLLYVDGDVGALALPALAIVGARNASAQGKANAQMFAQALARQGLCIVSGLAQGIDAAAHTGALDVYASCGTTAVDVGTDPPQARTIAVLGTGIDVIYPARHRALAQRIREHGALLSELPLGTPPAAHHFPQRNRLVAGLSLGVLVVEAARQSGSLITAKLAADQGRDVFALPGSIHSPLSRGCHALIQQGAKLVETVDDVLTEIGPQYAVPPSPAEHAPDGVTDKPCVLLDALGFDPIDLDALLARTRWQMADLATALTRMELDGTLVRLVDGRYQRVKR